MKPIPEESPDKMKSFRLYRAAKVDPNDRWEQRKRRWRVLVGSCFGIGVSGFLFSRLVVSPHDSTEERVVLWILLPVAFGTCVRYLIVCFRRKADDPIYLEIEKNAD